MSWLTIMDFGPAQGPDLRVLGSSAEDLCTKPRTWPLASGIAVHALAEPGPDLVGLGRAELGVQPKCLLPVVGGLRVLAIAVMALSDVAVCVCLLVGVAGICCELKRCEQLGASSFGLAKAAQGFGDVPQHHRLSVLVARLPEQVECLPQIADRLDVLALAQADVAQVAQLGGYASRTFEAAVDGQGLPVGVGGLGQLAATDTQVADPDERVSFAEAVFGIPEHVQHPVQVPRRLVVAA
jgi:hypothetical protein